MTKIRLCPSLDAYRRDLVNLLDQIRTENSLRGVDAIDSDLVSLPEIFPLPVPDLLKPPAIVILDFPINVKGGRLDDIIQINAFSEDVGVMNVYVSLRDDQGNHIEGDYALRNESVPGHWGYFPTAPVPSGRSIIAQAVATDYLGGTAIHTEILPLEYRDGIK